MDIKSNITELIGSTPLLRLENLENKLGISAELCAKLEYFNPAGSVKDRAALYMLNDAEKSGRLKEGGTIIEPTSGNTGIGLAAIAAARGYRVILTMPETMSIERRRLLSAYGAEIVLTDGRAGMRGAIERAEALKNEIDGSIIIGQFENPANPLAHFETTGPEIFSQTNGRLDIFVAGVGTGGTVSGIGRYLKSKNPDIKIVAVEPSTSPLLSAGTAGPHGLQGIGANFVPENLNRKVIDEVITVTDSEAFEMTRMLPRTEGLLVGISSGAALCAAEKLARREENRKKRIVVLLPDTGERYLSTPIFE